MRENGMDELVSVPDISPQHLDSSIRIPYRIMKNELRRLRSTPESTNSAMRSTDYDEGSAIRSTLSDGGDPDARKLHDTTPNDARQAHKASPKEFQSGHPASSRLELQENFPWSWQRSWQLSQQRLCSTEQGSIRRARSDGGDLDARRTSSSKLHGITRARSVQNHASSSRVHDATPTDARKERQASHEPQAAHPAKSRERLYSVTEGRALRSYSMERFERSYPATETAPHPTTYVTRRTRSDGDEPVVRCASSRKLRDTTPTDAEASPKERHRSQAGCRAKSRERSRERSGSTTEQQRHRATLRERSQEHLPLRSAIRTSTTERHGHRSHSRERSTSPTEIQKSSSGSRYYAELVRRRQLDKVHLAKASSETQNPTSNSPPSLQGPHSKSRTHASSASDLGNMTESRIFFGSLIQNHSAILILTALSSLVMMATLIFAHLL